MKRVPSSITKTTTGNLPLVVTLVGIGVVVFIAVVVYLAMVEGKGGERDATYPPSPDLGRGYDYRTETIRRFAKLMESPDWTVTDPPRNPQGALTAVHRPTGLTFVLIPAGSFLMGSPEDEEGREENEGPVHEVQLKAFLFCATECTQQAWRKGGGTNRSSYIGESLPVGNVSWEECHAWCEHNVFRLPSEAEWEYACRAGSAGRWCFGDDASLLSEYAWWRGNGGEAPHPVGQKLPNCWGLFDMHGNVSEWCEDLYHESHAGTPHEGEPWSAQPAVNGYWRVARGGDHRSRSIWTRSANRNGLRTGLVYSNLAFRPTCSLPEVK